MASFRYRGTASGGTPVEGVIEATNREDAAGKAHAFCEIVTSVERLYDTARFGGVLNTDLGDLGHRPMKDKELSLLCSQLAIETKAGLPIVHSLDLVAENTADRRLRRVVKAASGDVQAGGTLAASLETNGRDALPPTFIETVRAGEESGRLDECFSRLKEHYLNSGNIHSKAVSAVIYPIFLVVVAILVVVIIMVKAVPVFASAYKNIGTELPGVTKALISISNFFASSWIPLLAVVLGVAAAAKLYGRTEKGKRTYARLALTFPGTGRVNVMNAACQFSSTMSAMLASGLPMVQAVNITSRVIGNYLVRLDVRRAAEDVVAGRRLCDGLKKSKWLPSMLLEMTAVGEETGSLEETLRIVGKYFANEVDTAVSRALSIMEPVIIIVMAFLVAFILLSVYLPMFNLYSHV